MPNQILSADFVDALNLAGAGPVYNTDADRPLFGVGDYVYKLSAIPAAASGEQLSAKADIKQLVIAIGLKTATSGGVTKFLDQTQAFATPADGITMRTYTGWAHTTATPAATTSATTISRLWFYTVMDRFGVITLVHQSDVTDQAAVETYIVANFAAIWP